MKIKLIVLLLTLFVSQFSFGQIKVEDLKVDTTITGFHFAANFQGTLIYTQNGKADLNTINPSAFSFTIMTNASYQAALEQIELLLNMSRQDGYTHSDIVKKDTTINGNKAYYISFIETRKDTDYKNLVFDAFYIKENTILLFISGDLNNGKYIENFKRTFYDTKL
jgi:hypothetical protein